VTSHTVLIVHGYSYLYHSKSIERMTSCGVFEVTAFEHVSVYCVAEDATVYQLT